MSTKQMYCTECGNVVVDDQKFCDDCGTPVDWLNYEAPPEEPKFIEGDIACPCGQHFYYKTNAPFVFCINCNAQYPVILTTEEGVQNGIDI